MIAALTRRIAVESSHRILPNPASTCARRPRSARSGAPPGERLSAASARCGRAAGCGALGWSILFVGSSDAGPIGVTPWLRAAGAPLLWPREPRAAHRLPARRAATRPVRRRCWASIRVRCAVPCVPNLTTAIRVRLPNILYFSAIKSCEVSYCSASVVIRQQQFVQPDISVKKLR